MSTPFSQIEAENYKSDGEFLIAKDGYFGNHKYLDEEDLWELKFNDGRRIYYVIIDETEVVLLYGGNKNGQSKDIKKASNILRKIVEG